MAGGSKKNTKKRKLLNSPDIQQQSSKIPRKINNTQLEQQQQQQQQNVEAPSKMEVEQETTIENNQWRNLDLVLSIQSNEITAHVKVELAFTFVKSRASEEENGKEQEYNTLSSPRLIMYLSNWIQSLLISSEKKNRARDKKSEESMFCVDYRCWEIFQFCLDESSRRQVPLSLSRDLLRVISCVAKSALLLLDSVHLNIEEPQFSTMDCQLYYTVNDCLKLLFSSHSRLLNGNLDLWSGAVGSVLEVLIKTFMRNPQDRDVGNLFIEFSCLVLEPFSKFLKLHPCRKNGFHDFVDKLLEPLLHLLGLLPEKIQDSGHVMVELLFKLLQEIMSYGLFHNVHLDEYFCLQGSEKYSSSGDEKMEITNTLVKSYLRHLFDKVDTFVSERKEHALSGLGEMLHLFVNCVKMFKKDVQDPEGLRSVGSQFTKNPSNIGNLTTEKSNLSPNSGWNTRKSFFDFFVLTTEPLLLDLKKQLQTEFESGSSLKDVYYILNSVNKILYTVLHERIYVRTEDNSGGACLRFFKISYGLMLSCYAKFSQLWKSKWDEDSFKRVQTFHSVAKEFVLVVRNFLEIEYQVIGDDLSSIWLIILTFLAASYSSDNESELCPLSLVTVDLGCQVVNLYSELRQVNLAVLALCRGLKLSSFTQGDDGMPAIFTPHGNFVASGRLLLCSHRFRLAICNAIKSIPEGQANEYVETLTTEISDSLDWMKCAYSMTEGCELWDSKSQQKFSTQADILGMVLSEIYTLILDSLPVTTGISYRIGVSLQNLIGVLRPSMTQLVTPEQGGVELFIYSVLGITSGSKILDCENDWQHKAPLVLLFFFRLYMTCINLYRQTLSLMPPNSKKKMAGIMTDLCTAYCSDDLLEMADFVDEGYFSWIIHSSSSLLSILLSIKDKFLQEGSADHSCLIYVLHIMVLQRLVDLRRKIQCVEYIMQRTDNEISSELLDNADLSTQRKRKRKLGKFLSGLNYEAACLTGFILEYLPAEDYFKNNISMLSEISSNNSAPRHMEIMSWNLGVCTVNSNTLHTALWWIICQNIDIWCSYATKKKLKLFLKLLICNSLPYGRNGCIDEKSRNHTGEETKVTKHQISQELLCDTNFYDQEFVCRYMVFKISSVLKKFVPSLFKHSASLNADFSSRDWTEVLDVPLDTLVVAKDKQITPCCAYGNFVEDHCEKQVSSLRFKLDVAACRSLLNLLCRMMERSLSFKSSSRCAIYLVNFERLIVSSLLDPNGTLCLHELYELLGLLVSCRRALKYILMTFCSKTDARESSSVPVFSQSPAPILWLVRSLNIVAAWWSTLSLGDNGGQINNMIISLMDQTTYVLFTICKHQFGMVYSGLVSKKEDIPCESLSWIVGALEVEMKSFLPGLKKSLSSGKEDIDVLQTNFNKFSSAISCIQGFLWGLECLLTDVGTNYSDLKAKLKKHNHKTISRIIRFIDMFMEFVGISSQLFLRNSSCDGQTQLNIDDGNHVQGPDSCFREILISGNEAGYEKYSNLGSVETLFASCSAQNVSDCDCSRKKAPSGTPYSTIADLVECDSFNNCLRIDFLHSFLDGQNLEAAYFLRRLLIAYSAILRLGMLKHCAPLPPKVNQIFLCCSELLLTKFSNAMVTLSPPSFVWLDGILMYLEALGSQFSLISPVKTEDLYTKLVNLSLMAIGKCIALQGKAATLASHDIMSSTKTLTQKQALQQTNSDCLYGLDSLKSRLRMSFKVLIQKPSELHLSCIMQGLEQAVVGRQGSFTTVYDVKRESSDGGVVSSVVAAGVDCIDLLLEFLKGNKLLTLLKMHINHLIAALFNIMAHLQGPTIFYGRPDSVSVNSTPDSGSVVLMCVEVVTRIAGKPALFHLDSHHIAQSLNIPVTLFQGFQNLEAGKAATPSFLRCMGLEEYKHIACIILVDRQFSVNLFAASCRLLWTVVKHHKSDCVRLFFLLQIALQVLLHCLEPVSADTTDRKPYFTLEMEEGVKCASYLRRVYEEIRQQKDVYGQHCYMLLSDYIRLFAGYGPLKNGLKREVDEALRPGVYALIDVCSPKDLQDLHTVFGEGPCRSTLANLKHDYEHNFKYGGKV